MTITAYEAGADDVMSNGAPLATESDPASPESGQVRRYEETIDVIEADIRAAIATVIAAVDDSGSEMARARDNLQEIGVANGKLNDAAAQAGARTDAVSTATDTIAQASRGIDEAMLQASACLDAATRQVAQAHGLLGRLSEASAAIAGVVDAIAAVAKQTNLLALNATIEAARAGEAGKGFAVVAGEVKALSQEVSRSADDIRERIGHLAATAEETMAAVGGANEAIGELAPLVARARESSEEQSSALASVASESSEGARCVSEVSTCASHVDEALATCSGRMSVAAQNAERAAHAASSLTDRFVAVMRQSEIGDRRRHDRYPVELEVTGRIGARSIHSRSIDISRGGMLLDWPEAESGVASGQKGRLDIAGIGAVEAHVVGVSRMGLHCAFDDTDPAIRAAIEAKLAEIAQEYRPLVARAQEIAGDVGRAIEGLVANGRLSREAVFDTNYTPLPGTDPQQFETAYTGAFEGILPAIIEPPLADNDRLVFCLAIDRNGYIPVHNRAFSQPQRADDPVWNAAHCRNKRIFDDRAGITAARSTRHFVVQAYARDMGGGKVVMMREVDAPIRVFGRHWGGLRMAYRL